MKLIKTNQNQVSESKEVPGLLNCHIEYEVKSARGRLEYAGPKFTKRMWHQVLSFFRWTNTEMQSESQVRLYVNQKLGRWGAWAFPQQARTGMNARELPVPETPEQARQRFASWESEPSDDWLYFGTVHHHCSASAFQSSTDEENEWNQDGLHLTVGRMDLDQHELHARFYIGGNCFEPDLSLFWELDADLAAKVPPSMHAELARFQMGRNAAVEFPDAWRRNVVEMERERTLLLHEFHRGLERLDLELPYHLRMEEAMEELQMRFTGGLVRESEWLEALSALAANELCQAMLEVCAKHGVTPDDLLAGLAQDSFDYNMG